MPRERTFVRLSPRRSDSENVVTARLGQDHYSHRDILSHFLSLLVTCHTISREVSGIFYGSNLFCLDIRAPRGSKSCSEEATSYIRQLQLIDRLDYRLPSFDVKDLIAQFSCLTVVSVYVPPEPLRSVGYELNLEQRGIGLRAIQTLLDSLEESRYTRLRLVFSRPYGGADGDPEDLLTIKLLKHLRSFSDHASNGGMGLWIEAFAVWISGGHAKQTKLVELMKRIGCSYERKFYAQAEQGREAGERGKVVILRAL